MQNLVHDATMVDSLEMKVARPHPSEEARAHPFHVLAVQALFLRTWDLGGTPTSGLAPPSFTYNSGACCKSSRQARPPVAWPMKSDPRHK